MIRTAVCVAALLVPVAGAPPVTPSELFRTEQIWTMHLTFAAAEWAAIEPQGGGMPLGPPGRGGFGKILAGEFLRGDTNGDQHLSRAEFAALGDGWFTRWDSQHTGALGANELRAGVDGWFPGVRGQGGPGGATGMVAAKGKRNGVAGLMGIDFAYVHATLDFEGRTFSDVAVRYKGNGTYLQSRDKEKKSFKVDLTRNIKGQKLAGVTKLNLHSAVTDASWMNEALSYRLYRDAGVTAPRTAYARVFVTVPGKYDRKYFGLYELVEEVDGNFAQENYQTKDGLFLKPATQNIFGYLGEDWEPYQQPYDPKGTPTPEQKKQLIAFARLLTQGTEAAFQAQAGKYLDIPQVARYMAVTVWLSTLDSILGMGQNYYVYLNPKTRKMELLPWDLDHSFGQFSIGGTHEQREMLSILRPWIGANRFLERLYALPEFRKEYLERMAEYQKTVFIPSRIAGQVDEVAKEIRPAIAEESATMLARFDKVVAGISVPAEMFGFGSPGGPVKPIKGFVGPRAASVRDQLSGESQGVVRAPGGFLGPGGFGGPGGPRVVVRGPGLEQKLLEQFDSDRNGTLSREEFRAGFARWFADWNSDNSGQMSERQLQQGINLDLSPVRGTQPVNSLP